MAVLRSLFSSLSLKIVERLHLLLPYYYVTLHLYTMNIRPLFLCLTALPLYGYDYEPEPGGWRTIPAMLTAAQSGATAADEMKEMLHAGADPNARDVGGYTLLMIAAGHGNPEMVRVLLQAGADVGAVANDGSDVFHCLARGMGRQSTYSPKRQRELKELAELLIATGAKPVRYNKSCLTPLDLAACHTGFLVEPLLQAGAVLPCAEYKGFREEMRYVVLNGGLSVLLRHGLEPGLRICGAQTLLQFATELRSVAAVRILLAAGANVHEVNAGKCLLGYTIKKGNDADDSSRLTIARMLLAAGADPLQMVGSGDSKDTVLHSCANIGDVELLSLLLQGRQEHVDVRDSHQNTPLHVAAKIGSAEMVRLLIGAGADVNAVNQDAVAGGLGGFSVAACAAGSSKEAVAKLKMILAAGAAFDEQAQKNVMLRAAQTGKADVMRYLLSLGVSANLRTNHDIPLVQTATDNLNPGVMEALIAAGADVNAANNKGLTALHWAVQDSANEHSMRLIRLLLDAGGDMSVKDVYGRTPWDCALPEMKEWLRRR